MAELNQSVKLTTGKYDFPDKLKVKDLIAQMRLTPDGQLIAYSANIEEVDKLFLELGFKKIDRDYKLHVSAKSKEDFDKVFGNADVDFEERQSSQNLFIATVILKSRDDYEKFTKLSEEDAHGCRIRPFKPRYASANPRAAAEPDDNSADEHDDNRERRPQQNYNRGKGASGGGGKGKGKGASGGGGGKGRTHYDRR